MQHARRLLLCLVIIVQLTDVVCAQSATQSISLGSLAEDMIDRTRVAEFPSPEFLCKQCSSYNRESVAPDKPGWFANADSSFFYGHQDVDGRREWIMMDADGPGAIVRWWLTQQKFKGTVRIYLDGSDEPVYAETADALIGGDAIVGKPLSNVVGWNGRNLYLPIPFEERCMVTYDGPNLHESGKFEDCIYYNINYVKYPEGTEVQTFSKAALQAHAPLIARVQKALLQPEEHALASNRLVPGGAETLQPGGSVVRQVQGAGAITSLAIKLNADDLGQAMRSVVISISFDGKKRVLAPVGGFFGCGPGLNPFTGWWRQVTGTWWGEGDEKIVVDRETFPSSFGTGTEDYYGYSWGVGGTFSAPFHSMPRGDANGNYTKPGHTTNTRVRSLDTIPFKNHLQVDMELLHWQKTANVDYAVATYWYGMDGATANGELTPAGARVKVGDLTGWSAAGEGEE